MTRKSETRVLNVTSGKNDVKTSVELMMDEKIDVMTVPDIIMQTMLKAQTLDLPGNTKKDIVIQVLNEFLDSSEMGNQVAGVVRTMVPYLIDTIFDSGNANKLFDSAEKCCTKYSCLSGC